MTVKVLASGSGGNCYLVDDGAGALALDCGISLSLIERGAGFRLSRLDGCLLSHAHGDHAKSAAALTKRGVDVYSHPATFEQLRLSGYRFKPIRSREGRYEPFSIGSFRVLAFDVAHDCAGTLGFLVESTADGDKLVYITDAMYSPHTFSGVTHIMLECNYSSQDVTRLTDYSRVVKTHMSLETAIKALKANDLSRLRQIYLLHLSNDNSDAERFKREVQKATGAEVYVA